jgi:hypothetical protein
MADQILESLQWNIWDLCTDLEIKEESARRRLPKSKCREFSVRPLAHPDRVGPPELNARLAVPRVLLANISEPALFAVTASTDTSGLAAAGDVLLADLARQSFSPDAVYLFFLDGQYQLRWVREGANCIYLAGADNWNEPHRWRRIEPVPAIARIHAISKRQSGMFLRPVPPSAAN